MTLLDSILFNQEGKANSKIPGVIALLVIIIGGFLIYKFAPPYYQNVQFEHEIKEILNWDRFYEGSKKPTVERVYSQVLQKSNEMGIPLKEDDLNVHLSEDKPLRIIVDLEYNVEVTLPLVKKRVLNFSIHEVQDI